MVKEFNINKCSGVKLSPGYLLLVLLDSRKVIEVYDWNKGVYLYDITSQTESRM